MVVNIPIYSRDGSGMMVNIPKYKSKQATPSKSVKFAVNGVLFAVSAVGFAAKRRLRREKSVQIRQICRQRRRICRVRRQPVRRY